MLFAAGHAKNDIPSVLHTYQAQHPEMAIDYGRELAINLKLLQAAAARIEEAPVTVGGGVSRHDTPWSVVGRGAAEPDANPDVANVIAMNEEGLGISRGRKV